MRSLISLTSWIVVGLALVFPSSVRAIGWDSNDFLISGGPNFPDRIAVFDFDLSFKGYLDTNFLPVSGMDFDAAGHLVAGGGQIGYREVRVYDSSGAKIGRIRQERSSFRLSQRRESRSRRNVPGGHWNIGRRKRSSAVCH
jgi:hypothetical protein